MQADLVWFKANPEANYLVRSPRAGEIDELACGAEWDEGFTLPDCHKTCVVVLKVSPRRVVRFLAAEPSYGPYSLMAPWSLTPITLAGDQPASAGRGALA